MLWLKAFHIIFVVCWFAGIFYLPRIFVYYAASEHPETKAQLALMSHKLYRFVTPLHVHHHRAGHRIDESKPGLLFERHVDVVKARWGCVSGGLSLPVWALRRHY